VPLARTEDLEQVDDRLRPKALSTLTSSPTAAAFGSGLSSFGMRSRATQLSLSPVITPAMKKKALAQPLEFSDAGWSVAVSYPGQFWKRVDCSGCASCRTLKARFAASVGLAMEPGLRRSAARLRSQHARDGRGRAPWSTLAGVIRRAVFHS
jgi:hypothetical protein